MTLIPNNQRFHHGFCARVRAYRSQVINGVLAKVRVHWVCELTSILISLIPKYILRWTYMAVTHTLGLLVRAIIEGKVKWKPVHPSHLYSEPKTV